MPYLNPDELEMDYGLDPRKPMLPRALGKSPGGVLSQTVKPGEAQALTLPQSAAKYSQRANDLYDQGSRMMMSEPDVSSLQAFAKQRSQEGEGAMLNALAAQYAGENFQPLQAQFLKKATAAQDPLKVGNRGYITPQGSFVKDPTYTQEKQAEFLMQQAARYEQLAANATTAAERAEAMRAQQEVLNQMRMMGLQIQQGNQAIAQGNLDLRREMAEAKREAGAAGGNFTQSGFTPDGKQLVTNKTGMNFVLEMGPQGQPVYTPYTGAAIPKATFDKNVNAAQDALASASRSDQILNMVEQNPDAFGLKAAAVSKLPQFAQGRVGSMVLSEKEMKLRSDVLRAAAAEINQLYGAALSLGEQARANTFIPAADDPPPVIIEKLKAARDWARTTAQSHGLGVESAARARSGMATTAPAAPAGGLSQDEQAEYERLKKKYGR